MGRRTDTIDAAYFEELYREKQDPWGFETSAYEAEKYAATLGALGDRHFGDMLEIGCSIGVLTAQLSPKVDRLLAIDLSALALEMARLRCARLANVRFERRAIPDDIPDGRFDLILASEVLYYLTPADLMDTATACLDRLTPSGSLILCHWLGETDYPLSGSQASDLFGSIVIKALPIHRVLRDDVYRLERFDRL